MTGKETEDALVKRTIGSSTGRIAQRAGKVDEEVYTHEYTLSWSWQLLTTKIGWRELPDLPEDANIIDD